MAGLGPILARHHGKPAMQPLWVHPYPAQSDDFLQLHYVNTAGYSEGATTSTYRHPWSVWDDGASPTAFERYSGCSVTVWDSHDTFGQFYDAEAYALFCWARWRATGTGGAAGLRHRDDLDHLLNPILEALALA